MTRVSEAFADFDLDGDWDPDKHDKQMAEIYDGDEHEVRALSRLFLSSEEHIVSGSSRRKKNLSGMMR